MVSYTYTIEDERREGRNPWRENRLRDREIYSTIHYKRKKGERTSQWEILISKQRGYGEIGRRYGLNWIEPWYGNLLSDNFQIQRNPGINKNGQSWAKSFSFFRKQTKIRKVKIRIKRRDRCRDSTEAVLTNGFDCLGRGIFSSKLKKGWKKNIYPYAYVLKYDINLLNYTHFLIRTKISIRKFSIYIYKKERSVLNRFHKE